MKYLSNIFNAVIRAAQNKWVWLRVLILVITGFAGAIMFSRTKTKTKTDEACEAERSKLIQAFIDIRTSLQPEAQPTSFAGEASDYMFASFDTAPKQQMQQRKINAAVSTIDSILRADSIKNLLKSIKKTKA